MPILDKFPESFTPRDVQIDILNKVEDSLKSYDKIIISAPTGVGKSPIGITIAKHLGSSFVITAQKQLQDQYSRDYPMLKPVKGQTNYPCLKIMKRKKIDDRVLAMSEGHTCEKGQCNEGKDETGKPIFCKFKPDIRMVAGGGSMNDPCEYYQAKFEALTSDHSTWNYHGYFQLMLNRTSYVEYMGKQVIIFDEAHKIEDQILGFVGITITKKQLADCKMNPDKFKLDSIDGILGLLDSMRVSYARLLREMEEDEETNYKKQAEYETELERVSRVGSMIESDKENYIVNDVVREEITGEFSRISVKPIEIAKFVQSFFQSENQIFMSATIDRKSFCQNMGFKESEVDLIEISRSPFEMKNRKIQFDFCGAQGMRCTPNDRKRMISKIDEILDGNPCRGLILTSSKARCDEIENKLSQKNQKRIRQCHTINKGGKTQDAVIKEHKKIDDSVLLSSSLWEGVDLVDEMSRFQIIAKVPYPDLNDKRNSIKRQRHPLWFDSQAVMKTLQGCGRSIRNESDWAHTYVLDSAFWQLLQRTHAIIPSAYHDVLELAKREWVER